MEPLAQSYAVAGIVGWSALTLMTVAAMVWGVYHVVKDHKRYTPRPARSSRARVSRRTASRRALSTG